MGAAATFVGRCVLGARARRSPAELHGGLGWSPTMRGQGDGPAEAPASAVTQPCPTPALPPLSPAHLSGQSNSHAGHAGPALRGRVWETCLSCTVTAEVLTAPPAPELTRGPLPPRAARSSLATRVQFLTLPPHAAGDARGPRMSCAVAKWLLPGAGPPASSSPRPRLPFLLLLLQSPPQAAAAVCFFQQTELSHRLPETKPPYLTITETRPRQCQGPSRGHRAILSGVSWSAGLLQNHLESVQ